MRDARETMAAKCHGRTSRDRAGTAVSWWLRFEVAASLARSGGVAQIKREWRTFTRRRSRTPTPRRLPVPEFSRTQPSNLL
jgi:hypothetical protein